MGLMGPEERDTLTAKGVRQAVELAGELVGQQIDAIYCSTSKRCEQTLDEILRIRSDAMPIFMSSLLGPKMKSESYEKLQKRIEMFIDDLKNDHQADETVVIVSHQLPIGMIHYLAKKEKIRLESGKAVKIELSNSKAE